MQLYHDPRYPGVTEIRTYPNAPVHAIKELARTMMHRNKWAIARVVGKTAYLFHTAGAAIGHPTTRGYTE